MKYDSFGFCLSRTRSGFAMGLDGHGGVLNVLLLLLLLLLPR